MHIHKLLPKFQHLLMIDYILDTRMFFHYTQTQCTNYHNHVNVCDNLINANLASPFGLAF